MDFWLARSKSSCLLALAAVAMVPTACGADSSTVAAAAEAGASPDAGSLDGGDLDATSDGGAFDGPSDGGDFDGPSDGSPDMADATEACEPSACTPGQCGSLTDGCGNQLLCGDCSAIGETCGGGGVANECGSPWETLVDQPGCFKVENVSSSWETTFGGNTTYAWISIEYDTVHGGWRTDLYDREVLNHGLFGLVRNVPEFEGRYILGNAAQIHPAHPTLDRQSIFYGRLDLEPKPPGQGYTSYTSWRTTFPWVQGQTYHVRARLDAVARKQVLELYRAGQLEATQEGPISYFDPSLTAVPWTITFGGVESDGREVKPLGWEFCNLLIQAEAL